MHIISRKALREFWETHPDAESPLRQWEAVVRRADWRDWADLKMTYGARIRLKNTSSSTSAVTTIG